VVGLARLESAVPRLARRGAERILHRHRPAERAPGDPRAVRRVVGQVLPDRTLWHRLEYLRHKVRCPPFTSYARPHEAHIPPTAHRVQKLMKLARKVTPTVHIRRPILESSVCDRARIVIVGEAAHPLVVSLSLSSSFCRRTTRLPTASSLCFPSISPPSLNPN
jgi:hypothetical protein